MNLPVAPQLVADAGAEFGAVRRANPDTGADRVIRLGVGELGRVDDHERVVVSILTFE